MKNLKIYQLVFLLTPFVFSFAFGLDIYIPVIPQMAHIYATSPALVQLTLSLFLFVTGFGQLLLGPLSDQWGRKNLFFISSSFFALGSFACAFSGNIVALIVARVISGIGACGMLVTAFALVRDLYHGEKSAKIYSYLNGAIGISPTFAPIIGGYLNYYFGWQSIFIFLTVIGLFSLFSTHFWISETLDKQRRIPISKNLFRRFIAIFFDKQLLTYGLIAGFAESVFFCFFSISPFMIIELNQVPTHEFGFYFAIFGSVIALGGLTSGRLIEKIGTQNTIYIGVFLMFLGGFSMLAWELFITSSLQGFLVPMAIACMGAMFLVGCSAARALENFGHEAGMASAAFGSLEFGLSALSGSLLMLFPIHSTLPYAISIIIMAILTVGFLMSHYYYLEQE